MSTFDVVIPARYDSSRLPGKVLLDIAGKPMIQHVYERAKQSGASRVIIATDDDRVSDVAENFGATVCMTSALHQSGTERIAEVIVSLGFERDDIVVGLQADEPLISPKLIALLANNLTLHDQVKMATLASPLKNAEDLFNPNVVKVALNYRHYAMTFSRAPIPWDRDQFRSLNGSPNAAIKLADAYYRHVGLYAYRAGFLEMYTSWSPSFMETLESLEQLKVLYNGYKIHVGITDIDVPAGIDTEADLDRVRASIKIS